MSIYKVIFCFHYLSLLPETKIFDRCIITFFYKWLKAALQFCFRCFPSFFLDVIIIDFYLYRSRAIFEKILWTNELLDSIFSIVSKVLRYKGESHIDFCTQCVIMMQTAWPSPPPLPLSKCVISRFSTKCSFLKNVLKIPVNKKGKLHL